MIVDYDYMHDSMLQMQPNLDTRTSEFPPPPPHQSQHGQNKSEQRHVHDTVCLGGIKISALGYLGIAKASRALK